jgi:hypothetical protein
LINVFGLAMYSTSAKTCKDSVGDVVDYNLTQYSGYVDPSGTTHGFGSSAGVSNLSVSDLTENTGSCYRPYNSYPSTKTALATDGSGLSMTVTYGSQNATVLPIDGTVMTVPIGKYYSNAWTVGGGPVASIDSNGNKITLSGTNLVLDTLGTTALTVNSSSYQYTAPSGAAANVTVNTGTYTVETAFNCPNVGEYPPITQSLISGLTLPDGSTYVITYERRHLPVRVTGRIASVKLPTGATIFLYIHRRRSGLELCADGHRDLTV